jgi:hypothetical protein
MIAALLLGRKGSQGFPGKNTYEVLGRPLCGYPMQAANDTPEIDKVYLSTDCPELKRIAGEYNVEVIDRPDYLCNNTALGEDAYKHGYEVIRDNNDEEIEMVVLLFCNAPMVLPERLSEGINALRDNAELDSAVSVSRYNMWSPLRARKEMPDGTLQPFVPFETFGDPKTLNCDRDSQGDVLFADMSFSIIKPHCLEKLEEGLLPQKWMGQKIYPVKQEAALDVDYEWQLPQVEWWLKTFNKDCS